MFRVQDIAIGTVKWTQVFVVLQLLSLGVANPPTPKVEYVLFDLDGLLIDSERVYTNVTNAERDFANRSHIVHLADPILARYGREMTWDIKSQLMGKPERAGAELLWSLLPGIENELSIDAYLSERNLQQDLAWPHVPLLPGAAKLVKHLHAHGIPMCVATGSTRRNFGMKTMDPRGDAEKRELFQLFDGRVVCGDDSKLEIGPWTSPEGGVVKFVRGKPAPDVFLSAAELIGRPVGREETPSAEEAVERKKGLVFEDGIPGVQAAFKAGMQVVWIPDPNLLALDPNLGVSPMNSLLDFKPEDWGLPPYDDPHCH